MPEAFAAALATPGLIPLCLTVAAAGLVRGFTGFGTALIFVPVAGIYLPPPAVVGVMAVMGIFANMAVLPGAWRDADRIDVAVLAGAAIVTVPLGLALMARLDTDLIRWIVAVAAFLTLSAMVTGWRFSGQVRRQTLVPIGAAAGLLGGLTGLTGPVVILFYLTGRALAQKVRANTILCLATLDVALVVNLYLRASLDSTIVAIAVVLAVPYFITSLIGQAFFRPGLERIYRGAAYSVIALALVSGLPVWS